MHQKILVGIISLTLNAIHLHAQNGQPEKPVKTGNEWKMPSDVFKRSKDFAGRLQKQLGLNDVQAKKVYDAFLANTKPLDEISIQQISENEKEAKRRANKEAFNATLKDILTAAQYDKYVKMKF